MPLVLSLKAGHDFYVGHDRFVVSGIAHETCFTLRHMAVRKIGNIAVNCPRIYTITDKHATEVLQDVFVSAGDLCPTGTVRAVIDAPAHVLILRGAKYRDSVKPSPKHGVAA